eukprot:1990144-Pyramimonas_sp.AAC.1
MRGATVGDPHAILCNPMGDTSVCTVKTASSRTSQDTKAACTQTPDARKLTVKAAGSAPPTCG